MERDSDSLQEGIAVLMRLLMVPEVSQQIAERNQRSDEGHAYQKLCFASESKR